MKTVSKASTAAFAAVLALFAAVPSVAKPTGWEVAGDVSVIRSANGDITAYRFDNLALGKLKDTGCYRRADETVEVLSLQLYTPNRADDLFRARTQAGDVNSYRIPLNDTPRAIESWLPHLAEEGRVLRIRSVICGMGGFIYVAQISKVG